MTAAALLVLLATPGGTLGAFAQAHDFPDSPGASLADGQPSYAPESSSQPALPELEALRAEVQRLQLLVIHLQYALALLQQPEFDPATTPTLLDPLADLRVLFPDLAHRICLSVSQVGTASMPSFCSDAL